MHREIMQKRNDIKNTQFYNTDAGQFMVEMAEYRMAIRKIRHRQLLKKIRKTTDEMDVSIHWIRQEQQAVMTAFYLRCPSCTTNKRVSVYSPAKLKTLARDLKYLTKHLGMGKGIFMVNFSLDRKHVEGSSLMSK